MYVLRRAPDGDHQALGLERKGREVIKAQVKVHLSQRSNDLRRVG